MKNVFLLLWILNFGVVFAAGETKKSTTPQTRTVARYIQNPDGSWKVKHTEVFGPSELSVRPGLPTEGLTLATLAAMDAHDKAGRGQLED